MVTHGDTDFSKLVNLCLVKIFPLTVTPIFIFLSMIITGFDLMTCDSDFTILVEVFTSHILVENTYFMNHIELTEHKIMVLKHSNKYQISTKLFGNATTLKNIYISDFQHHSISLLSRSLSNIFMVLKITNCKDQTIIQIFIYYLIYLSARKAFLKIMQHIFFKEVLICNRCLINNILCFKLNFFQMNILC